MHSPIKELIVLVQTNPPYRVSPFLWFGLKIGVQAGLVASWLYATGILALIFGPDVVFSVWRISLESIGSLLLGFGIAIGFSVGVGMAPAAMIGGVLGLVFAYLIDRPLAQASRTRIVLACMSLCVLVTLMISVVFRLLASSSDEGAYWLFIGAPGVLFILTGGVVGNKLYWKRREWLQRQEVLARSAARRAALQRSAE